MYEFYIDGSRRNAKITYTGNPYGIEDDITIGEANLFKGQKVEYLFDFGDKWEFNIIISDIDKNAEVISAFEIIESKGESPDQYNDWH